MWGSITVVLVAINRSERGALYGTTLTLDLLWSETGSRGQEFMKELWRVQKAMKES